ncbi:MAG: helix-turn-helix domain-containing protein [Chloroflexota bacterium]
MTLLTHSPKKPAMSPDLEEFMTTKEAAEVLDFTVASVRQLVYKKKLEGIRFGRSLLIPKKAVKEYLEKTRGMSKNDPRRKIK